MTRESEPGTAPRKPAVVVTGAARGVGRAFADIAATEGRIVVLVDRMAEPLEKAAADLAAGGAEVHALLMDLVSAHAGDTLEQALADRGLFCDVLVNNAGFGLLGPALSQPVGTSLDMLALHIGTLTDLTLRFLPGMIARRSGGVLNVSSIVAGMSGPNMAVYNATKAYVRAFSLAMADELAGTGVTMTCLYPGRVTTEFWNDLAMRRGRRFHVLPALSPRTVAEAGWHGFRAGKASVIPALSYKIVARVLPLFSSRAVRTVTAGMFAAPPAAAPHDDGGATRPAIVVTGASSGIGKEIARVAAQDRQDVVLVARSLAALEELAAEIAATGTAAHVLGADLRAPGTAARIEGFLAGHGLHCEVLVNNAGVCLAGPATGLGRTDQRDLLDLNVRVATELLLRFLPGMVARGHGGLLNVGSLGAYMAAPKMAVYHASKAYIASLSDSLAGEFAGTGVTVSCVNPGVVQTPMVERLQVRKDFLYLLTPKSSAAFTAGAAWRGFRKGTPMVIPNRWDRLLAHLFRVLPRWAMPPLPIE